MQISRMDDALIEVPRGLTNVSVVDTTISDVHGLEGYYQYRDHSATQLARSATLEQVWFLFLHGRLPQIEEERAFAAQVARVRAEIDLDALIGRLVGGADSGLDPVHVLKAAWPLIAASRGMRPVFDLSEEERRRDALQLTAVVPDLLAMVWRRRGHIPRTPRTAGLGIVADYLAQVTGAVPSA